MRLSPNITPTKYSRPSDETNVPITIKEYRFADIDVDSARGSDRVVVIDEYMLVFYHDMGEVYVGRGHAHVGGAFYDSNKILFAREMVLDSLSYLDDEGVVEGLEVVREDKVVVESDK